MSAFFDRFRWNKGKVQVGGPAQMPATSSVWPEDRRDTLGLTSLYEPSDPQAAIVDIVFVHGLTGNSYTTWLHENGCHWPEKLLPKDIPDSRILSFGYDADVARFWAPASGNTVANHAQNLLGALSRLRGRTDTEDRKIIFVAHSLGGLVTKNALWLSSGSAEHYIRNVGSHTIGIAFLGTPHHGADLAAWASFGSRISQIVKKSNTEILAVLKPGSEVLAAIEDGFGNQLRIRNDQDFDITCFYEELSLPFVGDVVPKHSAIMEGRPSYGIHANHMSMTKFAHSKSQGYVDVSGELFRWVKDVRIKKKAVFEG